MLPSNQPHSLKQSLSFKFQSFGTNDQEAFKVKQILPVFLILLS